MHEKKIKPLVLIIADGWGIAPDSDNNAISLADTSHMDRYISEYPAMTLYASGRGIGLRDKKQTDSAWAHLNIGAGRVCNESFLQVDCSIKDKSFFDNKVLSDAFEHAKSNKSLVHLIGLLDPQEEISSYKHFEALLELAKKYRMRRVHTHLGVGGRKMTMKEIEKMEKIIKKHKRGTIASICGSNWLMDRDNRWERVGRAYQAIVDGASELYSNSAGNIVESYLDSEKELADLPPTILSKKGEDTVTIKDNDVVIFYNIRPDYGREFVKALALPGFSKFERSELHNLYIATMTDYDREVPVHTAFSSPAVHNCIAEVVSNAGLKQLCIAETEKYAHVTYYFNGMTHDVFKDQKLTVVSSPIVSSFCQDPSMSAIELAKEVVRVINEDLYDLIVVNITNAHSMSKSCDLEATVEACEVVDRSIEKIVEHAQAKDGTAIITASIGGAENVHEVNNERSKSGKDNQASPVPFLLVTDSMRGLAATSIDPPEGDLSLIQPCGRLADIAPTILNLLGIDQPKEMKGRSLI